MPAKPKIIFVVNEDWAFLTLRLPMARAAQDYCGHGGEVIIATRVNEQREVIESLGFRVVHIPFERGGINPLKELAVVWKLARLFRKERPDIVHNVALKPILDGSLAALFSPRALVFNTFTGMGAVFIGTSGLGLLKRCLVAVFRMLMRREKTHVIVQNRDDKILLSELGIARPSRTSLILGSGVNLADFPVAPEPPGTPVVTMVSRLLWDKGLGELVSAARLLSERDCGVKIQVVGAPDPQNPQNVDDTTLQDWMAEGRVDFLGYRSDVAAIWKDSHIAVLPSCREGLPKSLLEAASCGRPMIATDVPGCRELVKDGENGLLVTPRNPAALADAIERLAGNPVLRKKLGAGARKCIEESYADQVVKDKICELYGKVLGSELINV